MTQRKRRQRRRFDRPLCETYGPEDGLDPREWAREPARQARNRKALQLCRQVAQTLSLAFPACGDPALIGLLLLEVRPAPDSTRLLVFVAGHDGSAESLDAVRERLVQASGRLRREVAAAIHRRRTPELVFHVCND